MMTLEANGITYDGFKSATAHLCMENSSGSFSFSATVLKNIFTPIKVGDICKIYVDGVPVINGYVEQIDSSYDAISHTITISGRDKTCDIIDSSVGDKMTFSGGIGLVELTKQVLNQMGITGIGVSSEVTIEPFKTSEIEHSELGETVYSFLEKYAKKRQVLINTDGNGNIVFVRSSNKTIKTILTSSYNAKSTILGASLNIDDSKRFYKYVLNSQINPSAEGNIVSSFEQIGGTKNISVGEEVEDEEDGEEPEMDVEKAYAVTAVAYDSDIRKSRTYNFQAETPHKEKATSILTSWEQMKAVQPVRKDSDKRAQWEANIRMAKAKKYNCTVQGFRPFDDPYIIWKPNLLVTIVDEILNFNSQMLINSVTFDYGLDTGSKTSLELVNTKTFTLELIEGAKARSTGGKVEGYAFDTK